MRRAIWLLPVVLFACGEDWKGEGTVVDRAYDDDDSYSYMVPLTQSCSGSGLSAICTQSGGYMAHHREPERWLLTLEVPAAEAGKNPERHTVTVPISIYESCENGDRLDTETMVCTDVPR